MFNFVLKEGAFIKDVRSLGKRMFVQFGQGGIIFCDFALTSSVNGS